MSDDGVHFPTLIARLPAFYPVSCLSGPPAKNARAGPALLRPRKFLSPFLSTCGRCTLMCLQLFPHCCVELSGVRCAKTHRSRSVDSPPEVFVCKRNMQTHSFWQTSKMLQTRVRCGKHVSIRTQKRGVTWTCSHFYFPTWLKPDAMDVSWMNVCCQKRSSLCVAVKASRNKKKPNLCPTGHKVHIQKVHGLILCSCAQLHSLQCNCLGQLPPSKSWSLQRLIVSCHWQAKVDISNITETIPSEIDLFWISAIFVISKTHVTFKEKSYFGMAGIVQLESSWLRDT